MKDIIEKELKEIHRKFYTGNGCGYHFTDSEINHVKESYERIAEAARKEERERIVKILKEDKQDPSANEVTDHFIADDAYESKVEAFWYGYNTAIEKAISLTKSNAESAQNPITSDSSSSEKI